MSAPRGALWLGLGLMALVVPPQLGCGTRVSVTPAVAVRRVPTTVLTGRLLYRGEPEYVPRLLRNREDAAPLFVYSVQTFSGNRSLPGLSAFPLTLLGLPSRESTVTASARLEIQFGGRRVSEYGATARVSRLRGNYSSDPLAELKRRALLAIRDNLEAQLINDLDRLSQVLPR